MEIFSCRLVILLLHGFKGPKLRLKMYQDLTLDSISWHPWTLNLPLDGVIGEIQEYAYEYLMFNVYDVSN